MGADHGSLHAFPVLMPIRVLVPLVSVRMAIELCSGTDARGGGHRTNLAFHLVSGAMRQRPIPSGAVE